MFSLGPTNIKLMENHATDEGKPTDDLFATMKTSGDKCAYIPHMQLILHLRHCTHTLLAHMDHYVAPETGAYQHGDMHHPTHMDHYVAPETGNIQRPQMILQHQLLRADTTDTHAIISTGAPYSTHTLLAHMSLYMSLTGASHKYGVICIHHYSTHMNLYMALTGTSHQLIFQPDTALTLNYPVMGHHNTSDLITKDPNPPAPGQLTVTNATGPIWNRPPPREDMEPTEQQM